MLCMVKNSEAYLFDFTKKVYFMNLMLKIMSHCDIMFNKTKLFLRKMEK